METPTNQVSESAARASELNRALAERITRWKRFRLGAAIVLGVVGIAFASFNSVAVFAVPFLIGAFIASLLYLDARDAVRDVNSRNWGSATPRISKLAAFTRERAAKDTHKQD